MRGLEKGQCIPLVLSALATTAVRREMNRFLDTRCTLFNVLDTGGLPRAAGRSDISSSLPGKDAEGPTSPAKAAGKTLLLGSIGTAGTSLVLIITMVMLLAITGYV